MAEVKITGLPPDTSPTTDDYIVVVDSGSGNTKKVKLSDLASIFVTATGTQTFTNSSIQKRVTSVTSTGNPTPNSDTTDVYELTTLGTSTVFGTPTGSPVDAQPLIIRIKDNGTAQSLSFSSNYRPIGITLPTITTVSKTIYIGTIYNSADSCWDVLSINRQS